MRVSGRVVVLLTVPTLCSVAIYVLYAVGGSAEQLRALIDTPALRNTTTTGTATEESPLLDPRFGNLAPTQPAAAVAEAESSTAKGEADEFLAPHDPFLALDEESETASGPPTGEEFARLLGAELLGEVDPAAAEEFIRELRKVTPDAD